MLAFAWGEYKVWKDRDKREGIHLISLPFTSFYLTIAEGRKEGEKGGVESGLLPQPS